MKKENTMMKERSKKEPEDMIEFIQILAKVADRIMAKAVTEKGMDSDVYVEALQMVGGYTDQEQYDVAFDLMVMLASFLDEDAQTIVENLDHIDKDAKKVFLKYFSEYIEDWYVIERLLGHAPSARSNAEEDLTRALDEAYRQLKPLLDKEV